MIRRLITLTLISAFITVCHADSLDDLYSSLISNKREQIASALKLDKKEIEVADINTKRRKLGAIMGDGVETGINASINVGSIIGSGTQIGPGALAHGNIAPNSRIF